MEEWIASHLVEIITAAALGGMMWMGQKELREQHVGLRDEMKDGFDGVHGRLDTLNGKVFAHEGRLSKLEGRHE